MSVEIFEDFADPNGPLSVLTRGGHILFGITWIGLLYFFNFVQVPSFAELSDGARSEALRKLTFRGLWWFRWAALMTFLFGLLLLMLQGDGDNMDIYLSGVGGTAILTGMLFGTTMFLNVWGIIWRNQKVVIGNAETVAAGGTPNPEAPAAAKRAARASRANTLFSIPMLWYMVFAAHGALWFDGIGGTVGYWIVVLVLWAFVEASALGLIGGIDSPFNKAAFDKHKNTIAFGFALLVILHFVGWELILAA
ncbi:MAG TPA: urate hydroxylase PuuD [Acidimicrobiales bacterium]|nr:urate hydroxylase PuuD [Acidimicrobiales bacterium]